MTTVELHQLGKRYPDGHLAVSGVDLRIEDGEFFVLLGPSGCGKTSVLRMIAGLEELSGGDVRFDGASVVETPAAQRDLAMLFQASALYPHMSVSENLGFPLKMAGLNHRDVADRVASVSERLGIADLLDRRPSRLSGGQRQRVAMARALVREPALVLMDEPMSNLDAKLRTELRAVLSMLHQRTGATTVYVTHDQVEAMALADRLAVMRDGRVIQLGTPFEVYREPADVFVATFVGSPPMNVVLGRVVDAETIAIGRDVVRLGVTASCWPQLTGLIGEEVAVGVRPEGLALDRAGEISVEIESVEWTGPEQFASVRLGAPAVRSVDDGVAIEPGPTTVAVAVDSDVVPDLYRPTALRIELDQLHLFDLRDGSRFEPQPLAVV